VRGKDAFVEEFGGVIRPANLQNPTIVFMQRVCGSDFGCGNYEERLEM
jgi:hypothetical protein